MDSFAVSLSSLRDYSDWGYRLTRFLSAADLGQAIVHLKFSVLIDSPDVFSPLKNVGQRRH